MSGNNFNITTSLAGTGSGGGINYITNPSAVSGTVGWVRYKDVGTTPVDGTGGSPDAGFTWTRSTTTPLRGTGEFLLTDDGSSYVGNGVSYDFTIDNADKAKVLSISFDLAFRSGGSGWADEVTFWIYDVTNATLIQPAPYILKKSATDLSVKYISTFQTASNSTSYRFIIHRATSNLNAFTIGFDNFAIGPQVVQYGAPVTDWTSYTPTISAGFGTVTGVGVSYRRVGDSIQVRGGFTTGTVAASLGTLSLPSGLTVSTDTAKISSSNRVVGHWWRGVASATAIKRGTILAYSTIGSVVDFAIDDYTTALSPVDNQNGNAIAGNTQDIFFEFEVPITGWGSSVQMSNDTDTRVVAAKYTSTATTAMSDSAYTALVHATKVIDTHGAVSAGAFTAPVPGYYEVKGHAILTSSAGWGVSEVVYMSAFVNGSIVSGGIMATWLCQAAGTFYVRISGSTLLNVNAGDIITVRIYQNSGASINLESDANANWISFQRLSGPSAIAASESVTAQATSSTTTAANGSTIINPTEVWDSHGAYNASTGEFTCPVSGEYEINATQRTASVAAGAAGEIFGIKGVQTGSVSRTRNGSFDVSYGTSARGYHSTLNASFKCLAGDVLKIVVEESLTTNPALAGDTGYNWVEFKRVGNY